MKKAPPQRRGWPVPTGREGSADAAVVALGELITAERELVELEAPGLAAATDPGRVWLLWFSIGATEAVCDLVGLHADLERNGVFRQVVSQIFGDRALHSPVNPVEHDKRLIELFESAGAEAVAACMRGDRKLGYLLEALRIKGRHGN